MSVSLRDALVNASYEVLPFKSAEESVLAHVPKDLRLTITTTEQKGIEPTVDLAVRLARQGYTVAPHLAARNIRDAAQLDGIAANLRDAGIDSLFVVGGDAPTPRGEFSDAEGLLRYLKPLENGFTSVAIVGHPEGHGQIDEEQMQQALERKAPLATLVVSQLCFDPAATVDWARRIRTRGVKLPIQVGIPGPVNRQKLIRVSAGLGLGQSARMLRKQQSMLWRFFTPGGFSPKRLIRGLSPAFADSDSTIAGFHVFTFNDLEATEKWRREWLERLS